MTDTRNDEGYHTPTPPGTPAERLQVASVGERPQQRPRWLVPVVGAMVIVSLVAVVVVLLIQADQFNPANDQAVVPDVRPPEQLQAVDPLANAPTMPEVLQQPIDVVDTTLDDLGIVYRTVTIVGSPVDLVVGTTVDAGTLVPEGVIPTLTVNVEPESTPTSDVTVAIPNPTSTPTPLLPPVAGIPTATPTPTPRPGPDQIEGLGIAGFPAPTPGDYCAVYRSELLNDGVPAQVVYDDGLGVADALGVDRDRVVLANTNNLRWTEDDTPIPNFFGGMICGYDSRADAIAARDTIRTATPFRDANDRGRVAGR